MKLTETWKKALGFLAAVDTTTALEFAGQMWPDSPAWSKSRCGPVTGGRGIGMVRAGNGLLGKMRKAGLVEQDYAVRRSTGFWRLSPKGRSLTKNR